MFESVTESATFLTNANDGSGRLFVLDKSGEILSISESQEVSIYLDIRQLVGRSEKEQGLLGMAFHPNFRENSFFYVNYTDRNGDTVIARFRASENPEFADPISQQIILKVDQPHEIHNGGHLEFGPDGYLYISIGEGGPGNDKFGFAQSEDSLLGKILRINVDGAQPYSIPEDNPLAGKDGRAEIWLSGLRNPWRFSFDSQTGDLYIADVGPEDWEEINFLPAGSPGGSNFGWSYFQGNEAYLGKPPDELNHQKPVLQYGHSATRCAIIGGQVYRGEQLPNWHGVYLFADFCSGEIFGTIKQDNAVGWQSFLLYDLPAQITSFGQDENGELYVVGRNGSIFNLRRK